MKKSYLLILPVLALGIAATASAHGFGGFDKLTASMFGGFGRGTKDATPQEIADRHQAMFEKQAALLSISVDQFIAVWAEGKTLPEIAKQYNVNVETIRSRMEERRLVQMKDHLQALVTAGIITQAQADKRYAAMQSRQIGAQDHMRKGMMRGMGIYRVGLDGEW